jgi:hypothetical protein
MPAAEGQAARAAFERILSLRAPDFDRTDPKGAEGAREAAEDFLAVSARVGPADLATLTDQYARIARVMAISGRPEETRASFEWIEQGLQDGRFDNRDAVTLRFLEALLDHALVEDAREAVFRAPATPKTVERGAESVIINGIAVPVKTGAAS